MQSSNWGLPLGSLLGFYLSVQFHMTGMDRFAFIVGLATLAGFAWLRGGQWPSVQGLSLRRVLVKLWALAVLASLVSFVYWLLPEYNKPLYMPWFQFLAEHGFLLAFIFVGYIVFTDSSNHQSTDVLYGLGLFFLRRRPWGDGFKYYVAAVAVRAFFLPLMVSFCSSNIAELEMVFSADITSPVAFMRFITILVFYLDVSVVVPAYLFSCSANYSFIKSVDTSAAGVVCTLLCYPPFNTSVLSQLFPYEDSIKWFDAIPQGILFYFWMALMLFCLSVYAWASVAMGFKFGNLTYKGLVNWGPYRYSKHPAYLSKNLYWWLYSVPFIAHTPSTALHNTCFLFIISLVYYYRAKTEEKHLSRYAEYRAYAGGLDMRRSRLLDSELAAELSK